MPANPTPLINRAKVKALALHCSQQRARKFNRVSAEFLTSCNTHMAGFIARHVENHPSVGVTIR